MSKKFVSAIKAVELSVGGMKAVALDGHDVVICNSNGHFYAVEQRCGHMNAPLEMGTLDGTIVTCPLHFAQFDVCTGGVLANPVVKSVDIVMENIKTCSIKSYETKLESGSIWVAL